MNKDLYDSLEETLGYLRDYYLDWQDYIERFSFPRLDYYFFITNISSFYKILDLAFSRLEKWDKENEIDLFNILICIPRKIYFTDNIYNNFRMIRNCLNYNDLVLKKYKED